MSKELERSLKVRDSLALAFGCMIGWGWVVLVSEWIVVAGSFGAIGGFIAAGLVLAVVGVLYAELASAMPEAGGAQNYGQRAFGPLMGFVCSWGLILGYVSITVFEAVALPQVAEYVVGNLDHIFLWQIAGHDVYLSSAVVGAIGALVFCYLNVRGVKTSAIFQTLVTAVIVVAGILLFTGSFVSGKTENLSPMFVGSVFTSVAAVMVMAPFLMGGFDVIPQAAAEIDLPPKSIGKLIIVAVILGVVWYCGVILSVSLLFDETGLAAASLPAVDAAGVAWGEWGKQVLILGGLAGILTSWNGFLIGGSRAVYALAKMGALPQFFAKVSPKYHTPVNAIYVISAIGVIGPFFGKQLLVWISNAGSMGFVIAYIVVALSFLKLRYSEPDMPRPFKASFGKFWGIVGVIGTFGLLLLYFPGSSGALKWPHEWAIILLWFGFGFSAYFYQSLSNKSLAVSYK
ncbi:APC family permease [Sessilibacter sp. MAH4]